MVAELKLRYEQYFTGIVPLPPDTLHNDVKQQLRRLRKAPFRNSAANYRLRTLETRYNTFVSDWHRVLREREDGTYSRDLFKAGLRERAAQEAAFLATSQGVTETGIKNLFDKYRTEVERCTGRKQNFDFDSFQKSIVNRAKELRALHGAAKLSFKVVVKEGKVSIVAKAKSPTATESR
jgi:hypothetical protein